MQRYRDKQRCRETQEEGQRADRQGDGGTEGGREGGEEREREAVTKQGETGWTESELGGETERGVKRDRNEGEERCGGKHRAEEMGEGQRWRERWQGGRWGHRPVGKEEPREAAESQREVGGSGGSGRP